MPDAVVNALVNAGILGPILVAVGWYVVKLQRELNDIGKARVEDAKTVAERVLDLAKEQNVTTVTLAEELTKLRGKIDRLPCTEVRR